MEEVKPEDKAAADKLQSMKGAQFDKAFLQHEKQDHAKMIQALKQQQESLEETDRRADGLIESIRDTLGGTPS